MTRSRVLRNQKGFTLIEIIAVLVILGILAAIAIPKYFDIQSQARQKALGGAIAEAKARIVQYAAQQMLAGTASASIVYSSANVGTNFGDDWSVTFTDGTPNIQVAISGLNTMAGVSTTINVQRPQ